MEYFIYISPHCNPSPTRKENDENPGIVFGSELDANYKKEISVDKIQSVKRYNRKDRILPKSGSYNWEIVL